MSDSGALAEVYQDPIEIERGRAGVRYSAALEDGTPVDVLAIAPNVARQITSVAGFVDAFERAAAVHHECLVPSLAWGQLRDRSLHCAFARFDVEPLTAAAAASGLASIGQQVARGLAAAHEADLTHGAIGPDAVVLVRGRGAMLGGLGLFEALRAGGIAAHEAAVLLAEQTYVAPEVLRGKDPGHSSDVYSLGATLRGLQARNAASTSAQLAAVLTRAMEQSEENRWPSARALARALGEIGTFAGNGPAMKSRRGCLSAAIGGAAAVAAIALAFAYG